jgi:hypothetical protein
MKTRSIVGLVVALGLAALPRAAAAEDGEALVSAALPAEAPPDRPALARHPSLALLETGLAIGLNTAWYWWDSTSNARDWDLHWDWPSWRRKLNLELVRFDNNSYLTNTGSHTAAGTIVYLIGRGNGLGAPASVLLVVGQSVIWEFVVEFKEKPSLNDLFNNPLGGLAIGEPMFQLSEFFARGASNGVNETLAMLFSPVSSLNAWAGNQRRRPAAEVDGLGLPADVWHRFALYAGATSTRWTGNEDARTETQIGLQTELNTLPGYGRPGRRSRFFGPGRLTSIDAALQLTNERTTGGLLATRVALAGYHGQTLRGAGPEAVRGSSLVLTLANSFEYANQSRPGLPVDQVASFGVLGGTAEYVRRHDRFAAELRLAAFPDVAMVTSMAGERYQQAFGGGGMKTVLAERGYYFAYGLSLLSRIALHYYGFALGLDSRWDRHESFEGLDRMQEQVTSDFHLADSLRRQTMWITLRPPHGHGQLALAFDHTTREGDIGALAAWTVERRAALTLGIVF